MRRAAFAGCLAFMWAAAALADPPVALDPGLNEPVELRYQATAGTTLRYTATTSGQQNVLAFSANRDDEQSFTGTFELHVGVRQADATGLFFFHEIHSASLEARRGGSSASAGRLQRALEGTVRGIQMSPTGSVLDQEVTPPGEAGELDPFVLSSRALTGLLAVGLTGSSMAVGDSWTSESTLAAERFLPGFETTATLRATFIGYAWIGSRACAVLDLALELWSTLPQGVTFADTDGPAMAHGVGQGYLYFDQALGVPVLVTMDIGLVGQFSNPTAPVDLTYRQDIRLELAP